MTYQGTEHRYLIDATLHIDADSEEEAWERANRVLAKAGLPPDGSNEVTVGEGVVWVNLEEEANHRPDMCMHLNHLLDHMVEVHSHRREGLETVDADDVYNLHRIGHQLIEVSHANEGIHETVPEHGVSNFNRIVAIPQNWRDHPDYDESTDSIKRDEAEDG